MAAAAAMASTLKTCELPQAVRIQGKKGIDNYAIEYNSLVCVTIRTTLQEVGGIL
jgi:hypothetical protein